MHGLTLRWGGDYAAKFAILTSADDLHWHEKIVVSACSGSAWVTSIAVCSRHRMPVLRFGLCVSIS